MAQRALSRAKSAVKKVAAKLKRTKKVEDSRPRLSKSKPKTKSQPKPAAARKRRPQADVPVDVLNNTYTPMQTSLKAPFRANGAARLRDQELGRGVADDRWNDEDRLTNKSGDPRIGTHGRTYEPGESRLARKGRR